MTHVQPQADSLHAVPGPSEEDRPSATLLAAVVQYQALGAGTSSADVARNVTAHEELVQRAHVQGARLVLFPELSLTGYCLGAFAGTPYADQSSPWVTEGDPRLEPLQDACARNKMTVVVGAAWLETAQTPRLASLIIGPDGSLHPVFKTHLHGAERQLFVPGDGPGMVIVDGWRIALAICADAANPSHAAAAARADADVYAVSALYTNGEELRLGLHLGARSMDHRMFGLLANLGGETPLGTSCGLSGGWGPDGAAIVGAAGTGTESILVALERSRLDAYRSGGE
ncbi:Predicted amidohydrolase [Arthrobacter sp. yr096]|uniref:carbon-nitrogen hydrolase family protein n=1 Tax=Arthrobacter sp. yr096 TaxID=1761750 RepID=UPI0008D8A18A|nr:carbon-nitrogen hydrolase family protein [Arthrobacter sp. yr096]SEJ25446.1 Predicted amidohydrolase [Arthrobacter sp. yr096]